MQLEFSFKHKEDALVVNYTKRLNDSISKNLTDLKLIYRNTEKRINLISKFQTEIDTYIALNEAKRYVNRKSDEDSTTSSEVIIVPMVDNMNKQTVAKLNDMNQDLIKLLQLKVLHFITIEHRC